MPTWACRHVSCRRCGASNRVNAGRVREGLQPVCGRCGAPLHTSSGVVEVTDSRFGEQVLASPLPVLLDSGRRGASLPGDGTVIEDLASSLTGRVRVAKLNVSRSPEAAARLRIQGVPTVIVFKDGTR